MAKGRRSRGGRMDKCKGLFAAVAHEGEDAGSRPVADAADKGQAEDVTPQVLAGGGATDEDVWFRAGDDLEHKICRQRWSLRRHSRVSSPAFRPWCHGLPARDSDALVFSCQRMWILCQRVACTYKSASPARNRSRDLCITIYIR
jgi:hypothetical protein